MSIKVPRKKSRFLRTTFYISAVCATYTFTYDYLMPKPLRSKFYNEFQQKDERKIVVIGAGLVGLSTAYYLSQNP